MRAAVSRVSASLLLFVLISAETALQSGMEYEGWLNIRLGHSLEAAADHADYADYTERGNITLQTIRSPQGAVSPLLAQRSLADRELLQLQRLAESDGFYRVRSVVHGWDGTETAFLSSVKADALLSSGLRDSVTVWLLRDGSPVGVSVAAASPSASASASASATAARDFVTDVYVKHVEQAPVPDTASYIQKLEKEKEAREKGDLKDNRSFFSKYWMYIVPIALLVIISGAVNPEQQSNAR